MAFKFKLGQGARINASGETGTVIGRADYQDGKPQYLLRYAAADGRAVEQWWAQDAVQGVSASLEDVGSQLEGGMPSK